MKIASPQGGDLRGLTLRKEVNLMSDRQTSEKAAKAASKVLRSESSSKAAKTAAASALSQRAPKK